MGALKRSVRQTTALRASSAHIRDQAVVTAGRVRRRLKADFKVGRVEVSLKVLNIWGIDPKEECFRAELRICSRWKVPDAHQAGVLAQVEGSVGSDWAPEWVPSFSCWGCTERSNGPKEFVAEIIDGEVFVLGMEWFTVTLTEIFKLYDFPFDLQDLNIHLSVNNARSMAPPSAEFKIGFYDRDGKTRQPMVRYFELELPNFDWECMLFRPPKPDSNYVQVVAIVQRRHRFYK